MEGGVDLEIRQLECFLTVSETRSFTRAAERLFISQPSVTNHIRNLEAELGIRLFERSQKKAVLTSEGRIFHSHVERLMKGISHTLEEINAIRNLAGGTLDIGISPLSSVPSAMNVIRSFMDAYPDIRVTFFEKSTEELSREVAERKIDAAFVTGEAEMDLLSYEEISREELVACCSRSHPLRRHNTLGLDELRALPLILAADFGEKLKETLGAANVIYAEGIQTIKGLIAAGCGIAILPAGLSDTDDSLTTISLLPEIFLSVRLAVRRNSHLSHAAEAFLKTAAGGGGMHYA